MGLADAIARVRQGVKNGGLPAKLTARVAQQLSGSAIPARLRPAAEKLASLLSVAQPQPTRVVSLTDPSTHLHSGSVSVGVCPVSGMRGFGGSDDEAAHAELAAAAAVVVAPLAEAVVAPALETPALDGSTADVASH